MSRHDRGGVATFELERSGEGEGRRAICRPAR